MKRKKVTAIITAAIMATLSIAGCSSPTEQEETDAAKETAEEIAISSDDIGDEEALLIGAAGLKGIWNPLFAQSEADKKVCSLIFDTVCSIDEMGELEDAMGHFALEPAAQEEEETNSYDSYEDSSEEEGDAEEEEATTVYRLTLDKGLKFSDGSDLTIDDVIFTWKLMADPYYDGDYSLADVPVLGMQEYYYDTTDVDSYTKNLTKNYSSTEISEDDFIAYLIETKLDGWFDGNLPGDLDGKGTTWVDYLQSNGYDTTGIEEDADALLELLAKCEYEHYAFSYDPYTYYQNKAHEDLLAGGVEVEEIEGIQKLDDYTCTVTFLSDDVDAEALRAMAVVPVMSEAYYGEGYEKGDIENLQNTKLIPVGSGAYNFYAYTGDSVTLEASDSSRLKAESQYVKIKNVADEEKAQALEDGTIALASMDLGDKLDDSQKLEVTPVQGTGFYYLGFNTDMVNRPDVRKGIMYLVDKSLLNASQEEISEILQNSTEETDTDDGMSTSGYETGKIANMVSLTAQTWPMTRLSSYYPDIQTILEKKAALNGQTDNGTDESTAEESNAYGYSDGSTETVSLEDDLYGYSMETARSSFGTAGYWNNGTMLVRSGEQLKLTMGICEDLPDAVKAIAWKLKADLEDMGASVSLTEYTEAEMNATIPTAAFDMWIGEFTGLTDYDMSDYLKYRGEKNYFHHQDGYTDLAFADIEAATDEYDRAYAVKTMLKSVMEGNFCRPLCEEVSSVYVTNTSMVSWKEDMCLNEYDSFAEVVCNIKVK